MKPKHAKAQIKIHFLVKNRHLKYTLDAEFRAKIDNKDFAL